MENMAFPPSVTKTLDFVGTKNNMSFVLTVNKGHPRCSNIYFSTHWKNVVKMYQSGETEAERHYARNQCENEPDNLPK